MKKKITTLTQKPKPSFYATLHNIAYKKAQPTQLKSLLKPPISQLNLKNRAKTPHLCNSHVKNAENITDCEKDLSEGKTLKPKSFVLTSRGDVSPKVLRESIDKIIRNKYQSENVFEDSFLNQAFSKPKEKIIKISQPSSIHLKIKRSVAMLKYEALKCVSGKQSPKGLKFIRQFSVTSQDTVRNMLKMAKKINRGLGDLCENEENTSNLQKIHENEMKNAENELLNLSIPHERSENSTPKSPRDIAVNYQSARVHSPPKNFPSSKVIKISSPIKKLNKQNSKPKQIAKIPYKTKSIRIHSSQNIYK